VLSKLSYSFTDEAKAHEIHAYEVYAHEVHARGVHARGYTPMGYPSVRCVFVRYTLSEEFKTLALRNRTLEMAVSGIQSV
jgi:hypothetical protein